MFPLLLVVLLVLMFSLQREGTSAVSRGCCLCKKKDQALRPLPAEYDGPKFPLSKHISEDRVCKACWIFSNRWIQVSLLLSANPLPSCSFLCFTDKYYFFRFLLFFPWNLIGGMHK